MMHFDLAKSLYIGSLPFDVTDEMVRTALGDTKLNHIVIARNAKGLFMGYAFAELTDAGDVVVAIKKMQGMKVGVKAPREIHVGPAGEYADLLQRIGK